MNQPYVELLRELRRLGFRDEREMVAMINQIDLAMPGAYPLFTEWMNKDGSKAGLQYVIGKYPKKLVTT